MCILLSKCLFLDIIKTLKNTIMKTTIEKVEASLKNTNKWIITVICPSPGAIIVINNAFTDAIETFRKDTDGMYVKDKVMGYSDAARGPLTAMIAAHNNSAANQNEADFFANNMMEITK
jgi:hypothetical protein